MCGIFFYLKKNLKSQNNFKEIENFEKIKKRGPDNTDQINIENGNYSIFLGFHRLSIVGLEKKNNNIINNGNIYLLCNGEIYNYKKLKEKYNLDVKTDSDCEVILELYKKNHNNFIEKIKELDGVFSFIIFDKNINKIIICRDRVGVRPLFYTSTKNELCFSSEAKSILINKKEVTQVNPGTYTEIEINKEEYKINKKKWFDFEDYKIKKGGNLKMFKNSNVEKVKKDINLLLNEAVKKRLECERPIGFLVSGGLDSSIVAAIAKKNLCSTKKITTFSIGLENSPDLKYAKKVAKHLDSIHHEIIITTDEIIKALPEVIKNNETYDITTTRASIPMFLLSKYIKKNTDIKVIFSGEGADELFGGYIYFHNSPNNNEFHDETIRLLKDLHHFDVLRSDRSISSCGLELRVPFLDAELMDYVLNIEPNLKLPTKEKMEKLILRQSFSEDFCEYNYLPNSILYRQKEAFSDGVGYNCVNKLKEYAQNNNFFDNSYLDNFIKSINKKKIAIPISKEGQLYFYLFCQNYEEYHNIFTPYYWMPKWNDNITDPSAIYLNQHISQNKKIK